MNLICYRISADAPELIPARSGRAWMDAAGDGYPYRCIPLTVANATGWELICPAGFTASWSGGAAPGDLSIEEDAGSEGNPAYLAQSVFGHGVLSFHPGYLFRTDADWALWCRGAPNSVKDGIVAPDALVETDWLPFSFTMNWRFTRPGSVRFEKGEPFCFILPLPYVDIESIRPKMLWLSDDPRLQAEHDAWAASRGEFGNRLCERDPETTGDWQHFYYRRTSPARTTLAPRTHRVERRMAEPITPAPSGDDTGAASTLPSPPPRQGRELARSSAQNIIWIASYPKSGNTWVRVFIHNLLHELAGETDHVQDINSLQEYTVWENRLERYAEALGKPATEASQTEIARARPEVQRRLAATRGAPLFVKTHLCLGNDYRYPTINLDATLAAIYIVRNPLDVAV